MANTMFIGTRERMLEVKCPNVTMPSGKNGWSTELNFLNGGASIRRSTAASKKYEMTWAVMTRDEARVILDLADRLHGLGEIYWLDPFVADKNMLPQYWASPMQGLYDGLPLTGGERPVAHVTPDSNGFPIESVEYDVTGLDTSRTVWIPIPPGYTAYVGVYGIAGTGGYVQARPSIGPTSYDTPHAMVPMSVSNPARYNYTVSASDGYNGVELSMGGTGTVILTGMIVQVLKDGHTPTPGGFISGQGHSGCQFTAQPEYTPYSAAYDMVGMVASFTETGAWDQ